MNVRDITVQFNVITDISDAVGVVLFHCFTKYFVCCKKERTELDISNTKYNYIMCYIPEDYDGDDGENSSSVTMAVLSGPTLRLGD